MSSALEAGRREPWNEAFDAEGDVKRTYTRIMAALDSQGAVAATASVDRRVEQLGVTFGTNGGYRVDPVPRLIGEAEWSRLAGGLEQRLRAVIAFLEDSYSDRKAVEAGVIPARVLDESIYIEPVADLGDPAGSTALIAGPDLIRSPSGELLVLEDNLRTPSGLAYALAERDAVASNPALPVPPLADPVPVLDGLAGLLRSAHPGSSGEPRVAMLSDGPASNAWFEHRQLAAALKVPIVTPGDLRVRDGFLTSTAGTGPERIDILYNRSSQESLRDRNGNLSPLGEILSVPLKSRRLRCVNPFGCGLADDKAVHCYVDRLIRFFLAEEPVLRSVPGFDLGDPVQREVAMDHLRQLVIKPRFSFGGQGIFIGPGSTREEIDRAREEIRQAPADFVAQELVDFSVHPTASGDRFESRHIDLRGFVISGPDRTTTLPVALTRFSGARDDLIVNSTRGGGCKDTWILT